VEKNGKELLNGLCNPLNNQHLRTVIVFFFIYFPSSQMSATIEIPFLCYFLHKSSFLPDDSYEDGAFIQWHTGNSILYIVNGEAKDIDLRIDSEIFDIRVCI